MSAVVVKQDPVRNNEEQDVSKRMSPRRAIRRKSRLSKWVRRLLIPVAVVVLFLYIALHASVTAVSYRKSKLMDLCKQESVKHERLKVELIRISSPRYVTAAAQKAGMVCATRYDYLSKPPTVASADR